MAWRAFSFFQASAVPIIRNLMRTLEGYGIRLLSASTGREKGFAQVDRKRTTIVALLLALVWVTGCATMTDVLKAKDEGKGMTRVYPVSADQAWYIAKAVFRSMRADAIEEHRAEGYMLTSSGATAASHGALAGAWVEPIDQNHTKITVVTKRRVSINIVTTLTETTFHRLFAQAVEIEKAGKPLLSPPLEPAAE